MHIHWDVTRDWKGDSKRQRSSKVAEEEQASAPTENVAKEAGGIMGEVEEGGFELGSDCGLEREASWGR